jgi:hypothetical protein
MVDLKNYAHKMYKRCKNIIFLIQIEDTKTLRACLGLWWEIKLLYLKRVFFFLFIYLFIYRKSFILKLFPECVFTFFEFFLPNISILALHSFLCIKSVF